MKLWPSRHRDTKSSEEAEAALREANRALVDAKQLRSRADDVGDRLAQTRRDNHIALAVELSMMRRA